MKKKLEIEIKVGIFITVGVALIMASVLFLGGGGDLVGSPNRYKIHFPSVQGLFAGSKVVLNGFPIGLVDSVDFDTSRGDIIVGIKVAKKYGNWVKKDSEAELQTQGLLGDKFISVTAGTPDSVAADAGAEIPFHATKDFSQVLSRSDQLMINLNSISASLDHLLKSFEAQGRSEAFFHNMFLTSKNMASASGKLDRELEELNFKKVSRNLNNILEKVNNGSGTLGALINDPSLYDDAKALVGGANRNRIVRNLVRKTIHDSDEAEALKQGAAGKK